ncbi:Peptidoglycan binding domain-containing protein OS=Streptomyces antimycoticus OX=68175 GN=SANT12839_061510 PE=4 SV=1 [Streptomyces antimycoticus]
MGGTATADHSRPTPPGGSPMSGSLGATTGAGPRTGPGEGFRGDLGSDPSPSLFRDPDPTPGGGVPSDQISSDTLVSGVPVVPSGEGRSRPPAPPAPGGLGAPARGGDSAPAPSAPKAGKPKKKGRSKVVMAAGLLLVIAGGAYAAGLVMNDADVPNGTTVLGVDVGGSSKEVAVDKLDTALGKRTTAPDGVRRRPAEGDQPRRGSGARHRGHVRNVAGRDYNPVTVIGSLFGGHHEADPAVTVDEEKLRDALEWLAGDSGTAREGGIDFSSGKPVAVYGKEGRGLDVDKAVKAVWDGFRLRAETGQNKAITLPVATRRPHGQRRRGRPEDEELRQARDVGSGHGADGPPALDSVRPGQVAAEDPFHEGGRRQAGGALRPVGPEAAVRQHLRRRSARTGRRQQKPVAPEDVESALRQALLGKTPSERIGVIGKATERAPLVHHAAPARHRAGAALCPWRPVSRSRHVSPGTSCPDPRPAPHARRTSLACSCPSHALGMSCPDP